MLTISRKFHPAETKLLLYFNFFYSLLFNSDTVKKGESDSEYDELAEGVNDLSRIIEGKPIKLRRKKKKKQDEEEQPRTPVDEHPIVAEEFVPLLDDTIAKTDGKGLLNVRVVFVIGELSCFFRLVYP